jgi:cell wall-associated NlpC family hydrolase
MRRLLVLLTILLAFPATASARDAAASRAVELALRERGVPYVWGGDSPSGFDCSGLVRWVYGRLGVDLPHSSYEQFRYGRRVARAALRPGDLVFSNGLGHVGIYVGDGMFVHAPHTGARVRVDSVAEYGFDGARRLLADQIDQGEGAVAARRHQVVLAVRRAQDRVEALAARPRLER